MAVSESDVRHFLGRVGFAPSDQEVAHFVGREIDSIVDEVLNVAVTAPSAPAHLDVDEPYLANIKTMDWWLNRMRDSQWVPRTSATPSPLVEKMTLFWHGHFATEFEKVQDATLMWEQNQILRTRGLGDFEVLCREVCLHGAMLIYLDNESNMAGAVQENFARELMELFTMGIGHYTEFDVVEMARAWTGHGTIGWVEAEQRYDGTYRFHRDRHDDNDKTIFGITQNWDGPDTITEICRGARRRQTAVFLATKLWRFFVNGTPDAGAISTLADAFIAADLEIKELMRALLTHPYFWDATSRRALVKTPTNYVVDFNRCTQLPFIDQQASWYMNAMGQELFAPPNVSGWGSNGYWLSTATMWGRAKYANDLRWAATNETGFLGELATMNVEQGTDHLLRTFRIPDSSAVTRSAIATWFTATKPEQEWALAPVGITVAALCPEFQVI